jgi:hypothetical protein
MSSGVVKDGPPIRLMLLGEKLRGSLRKSNLS